jgi:hypothetical protein
MRFYKLALVIATTLIFCWPRPADADIAGSIGINGGYTENLLNDSTDVDDSFSAYNGSINIYPVHFLELQGTADYTYYSEFFNLSNINAGLGLTLIPTPEASPLSLYFSTKFDGRRYRESFEAFDNNTYVATASAGYRLQANLLLRAGLADNSNHYLYSDKGDKETTEAFLGLNTTFLGRNSFDLEFGFGLADYKYIPSDLRYLDINNPENDLEDGRLEIIYAMPRISRPLGSRTGINLTYTYRSFMNSQDGLVFGSSVGLLSPWNSVWEGHALTLNVKTYLLPGMIASGGVGYWEKTFLPSLEGEAFFLVRSARADRVEVQRKWYLQFQRPLATRFGLLQPSLRVDYVSNSSSTDLYRYSGFSLSLGITYQL